MVFLDELKKDREFKMQEKPNTVGLFFILGNRHFS